jgi:hypothetical protein
MRGSGSVTRRRRDLGARGWPERAVLTDCAERNDPNEPRLKNDATDAVDRPDPTDPSERTDPTESIEPADPTDRIDPADPTERIDPTEPTDRIDPADPTERIDPPQPTDQRDRVVDGAGVAGVRARLVMPPMRCEWRCRRGPGRTKGRRRW